MNQKNSIIILIVIAVVLVGVAVCFMITKNAVPQGQNNQNQRLQTNTAPQTSNLTKLDEFGIEVEFSEGYDIAKSEGKTIIIFGPLGGDLGPVQTNDKYHIYELYITPKLSPDKIITRIRKDRPEEELIVVKPEIKTINNLTVVKWAEGGMCENRMMEVVGPKNNYLFSSLGCHQDQKFDFDYFEKTIKTIKFL